MLDRLPTDLFNYIIDDILGFQNISNLLIVGKSCSKRIRNINYYCQKNIDFENRLVTRIDDLPKMYTLNHLKLIVMNIKQMDKCIHILEECPGCLWCCTARTLMGYKNEWKTPEGIAVLVDIYLLDPLYGFINETFDMCMYNTKLLESIFSDMRKFLVDEDDMPKYIKHKVMDYHAKLTVKIALKRFH